MYYRVLETDSYNGDYPDESFAGPLMSKEDAERVAKIFNDACRKDYPRY